MRSAAASIVALFAGAALAQDAGSIKGKISYEGAIPKPIIAQAGADAHCKKEHPKGIETQKVKVKDGGLADVFVQIKESTLPKDKKWETPKEPVVLDQKGCEYRPHVFGVMAGQGLLVRNSDPTQHNIHSFSKNAPFNFSQSQKGMEKKIDLTKTENFVIKCDVHNWMNAHAFVMSHPFFATSAEDGAFEIKNVPPGTYDVELWHESLGTRSVKGVKVEAGKPAELAAADTKFTPKKPGAPARKAN
jgi:hypothetical protein